MVVHASPLPETKNDEQEWKLYTKRGHMNKKDHHRHRMKHEKRNAERVDQGQKNSNTGGGAGHRDRSNYNGKDRHKKNINKQIMRELWQLMGYL